MRHVPDGLPAGDLAESQLARKKKEKLSINDLNLLRSRTAQLATQSKNRQHCFWQRTLTLTEQSGAAFGRREGQVDAVQEPGVQIDEGDNVAPDQNRPVRGTAAEGGRGLLLFSLLGFVGLGRRE